MPKFFSDHRNLFIPLADRILRLDFQDGVVTDEPLMSAINHPVGHITQALLDWWYRDSLKDNQGIPDSLRPILIKLTDTRIDKYRHARVILATHVITLFRVSTRVDTAKYFTFNLIGNVQQSRLSLSGKAFYGHHEFIAH